MNFKLNNKVAVITGAAGVICSCIAEKLSDQGAKVALLDLNLERAQAAADNIERKGGIALAVQVNVLDKDSILNACNEVISRFGTVDILINGAGGNKTEATTSEELSFFDMPQDAIQWVSNLNFMGTVLPSQVFGKILAEKKEGVIVNISSMAAYAPLTKTLAYSAAKAAVSNFTNWLSVHMNQEYSPRIRVNAIAPGFLYTEQNKYLLKNQETGQLTARGEKIIAQTPMLRFGEPEELAGAVVFLASDEAKFVTGVVLPVDGGFNAYSGV